MKKILAHKIIYKGKTYDMSVVTLDGSKVISIEPFEKEIPATKFVSGTLDLDNVVNF